MFPPSKNADHELNPSVQKTFKRGGPWSFWLVPSSGSNVGDVKSGHLSQYIVGTDKD